MANETTKKQFTFRGKTIEEMKALDVREFAKLLASRERRFVLRQFNDIENFINRANKKIARSKAIRTHKRDLIVVPGMIGMKIQIHDGRNFVPIEVVGEMLGHKFGEFAPTRGKIKHGKAGIGATKGTKANAKK
ncbi:ribosomal protein S19 family protein [Candidatus Pacearchaeota archaeon]|nr:ribosomal protein S19 family protein [Candidatus Pacearchaeota archaeon]